MKRHEKMLLYLRADQRRLVILAFGAILVAAIPGMITVGMTMAYTLVMACLFPRKVKMPPMTIKPNLTESSASDAASQTNTDGYAKQ